MTSAATPAVCALAVALAAAGCGRPDTDIVAINSEDVGDYHLRADRHGTVLRGVLCVSRPARGREVAQRVLHQLYSRGLNDIELDVYSAGGGAAVVRVVERNGAAHEEPLSGAAPPGACGSAQSKKEPS